MTDKKEEKKPEVSKVEPPVEKTAQQRSQACSREIGQVLQKYNCSIVGIPRFRARDDGTFSITTITQIMANRTEGN